MKKIFENIPEIHFSNLYLADPIAKDLWCYWLGKEHFDQFAAKFEEAGKNAAEAQPFSELADQKGPVLKTHNYRGERIDQIEYHPAYQELKKRSYGIGLLKIKYDTEFLKEYRPIRHRLGFALSYYFAQTEIGLYCPLCMTDGVGRVLERNFAENPIAQEIIAHLSSDQLEHLWEGAMFLTEKQGGSDVGANKVRAEKKGDKWLLYGNKWFCSNVDAKAILALARMPDAPEGTKGLGIFLVLRENPTDNSKNIRIHRLKEKLGVRSMASGEVDFEGAEAFLVGGENKGFKIMAEMLNLSRLYNAVSSVAVHRRALFETLSYGYYRQAFKQTLWNLPLWRSSMADVCAEHMACHAFVWEAIRCLDESDAGDEKAGRLLRVLTPMAKALTGKTALWAVSECLEGIGGNAYIEENILPRLLRDTQVLPIWEGTTNILALDTLRAMEKEGGHVILLERCQQILEQAKKKTPNSPLAFESWDELKQSLETKLLTKQSDLEKFAKFNMQEKQLQTRHLMETMGRLYMQALLMEQAMQESLADVSIAAALRIARRSFSTTPVSVSGSYSQQSDQALLQAYFRD